jgi:hypothetical protein
VRVRDAILTHRADLLLAGAVILIHVVSPSPQTGDSRLSMLTAWRFATRLSLDISSAPAVHDLVWRGDIVRHGEAVLPYFPWPPMLLALPGTLIARIFGVDPETLSISDPNLTWIVEVPTASVMVAVTAVMLRHVVLGIDSEWATPRIATFTAVAFAFTTIAWSAGSRALWQQTASMLFLTAAVLAAQRVGSGGRWPVLLGAFAGMALVSRPTNAVIVAALVGWMLVTHRRLLLAAIAGGLAVLVPFLLYSWSQYGQPLPPYYRPGRILGSGVYEVWESAAVNLVSPARGLLIFVPVTFLAVAGVILRARRHELTALDTTLGVSVIAQFIVIARFGSTHGFTYGPRLLMDVVPFLMILAVPTFASLRRPSRGMATGAIAASAAVALVLAWGLFVNGTGALSRAAVCWNVTPSLLDYHPERVWDWGDPQFLRPWRELVAGRNALVGPCID